LPSGCAFQPRCEYSSKVTSGACNSSVPSLSDKGSGHHSRCHLDVADLNNLVKDKA
jgi:peptide/nickel transport system ATP-binding protein